MGRGSENKIPFAAAVSLSEEGHPLSLKLNPVPGVTSDAIESWAKKNISASAVVNTSAGRGCFAAVVGEGCKHQLIVVGARKPRDLPEFTWVNTVLGNLRTTLSGAFHAFSYRKYAHSYFAAFVYRFNRRFNLRNLVVSLIADVTRSAPLAQRVIRGNAEAHC